MILSKITAINQEDVAMQTQASSKPYGSNKNPSKIQKQRQVPEVTIWRPCGHRGEQRPVLILRQHHHSSNRRESNQSLIRATLTTFSAPHGKCHNTSNFFKNVFARTEHNTVNIWESRFLSRCHQKHTISSV